MWLEIVTARRWGGFGFILIVWSLRPEKRKPLMIFAVIFTISIALNSSASPKSKPPNLWTDPKKIAQFTTKGEEIKEFFNYRKLSFRIFFRFRLSKRTALTHQATRILRKQQLCVIQSFNEKHERKQQQTKSGWVDSFHSTFNHSKRHGFVYGAFFLSSNHRRNNKAKFLVFITGSKKKCSKIKIQTPPRLNDDQNRLSLLLHLLQLGSREYNCRWFKNHFPCTRNVYLLGNTFGFCLFRLLRLTPPPPSPKVINQTRKQENESKNYGALNRSNIWDPFIKQLSYDAINIDVGGRGIARGVKGVRVTGSGRG